VRVVAAAANAGAVCVSEVDAGRVAGVIGAHPVLCDDSARRDGCTMVLTLYCNNETGSHLVWAVVPARRGVDARCDGSLMPKENQNAKNRQLAHRGSPGTTRKARLPVARGLWHCAARPEHVLLASRRDPILERYLAAPPTARAGSGAGFGYLLVIFGYLVFGIFAKRRV
jgi:hypothetical protein